MKILTLDIETSPNLAHVWGLFNQNVSLVQLQESAHVMSWAAKWYGKKRVEFASDYHDGHRPMLERIHELMSEADVLVHYNGVRFDIPHLQREFVEHGMEPPAPYQQVDLYQTVRSQFRFPSNKLDFVCQTLNLGAKQEHTGHQLWVDCLSGKRDAWRLLRRYNKQDVVLTEALYDKLRPWIKTHPSHGLYNGVEGSCPACGSTDLQKRGFAYTQVSTFQRYQCQDCGRWSRGTARESKVVVR